MKTLDDGATISVRNDENNGGNNSIYRIYRAPKTTLILSFKRDAYYVYDKDDSLELVKTWAP